MSGTCGLHSELNGLFNVVRRRSVDILKKHGLVEKTYAEGFECFPGSEENRAMVMSIRMKNDLTPNHDGVGCVRGAGKTLNERLEEPLWVPSKEQDELTRYRQARFKAIQKAGLDEGEANRITFQYDQKTLNESDSKWEFWIMSFDGGWMEAAQEAKETELAKQSLERMRKASADLVNGYQAGKGWRS